MPHPVYTFSIIIISSVHRAGWHLISLINLFASARVQLRYVRLFVGTRITRIYILFLPSRTLRGLISERNLKRHSRYITWNVRFARTYYLCVIWPSGPLIMLHYSRVTHIYIFFLFIRVSGSSRPPFLIKRALRAHPQKNNT